MVAMRWGMGDAHHVGYVVPHDFHGRGLIHAAGTATGGGRVVEHGMDAAWLARLITGWAL